MNKLTKTKFSLHSLAWATTLIFAGCGILAPTIAPTRPPQPPSPMAAIITPTQPSPTATPPFVHYSPSKESSIHLEFDYPGSWIFSEETREAGIMVISLGDPRFRTLPTSSTEDFHSLPKDFGSVNLWIFPSEPSRTLETRIDSFKQSSSATSWITLLNDYKIKIDDYDATVLEYQIKPFPEGYTSLMFERNLFFVVEDQIYQIIFRVAEKDRGGEFEQGYEYFFNSIKIVP